MDLLTLRRLLQNRPDLAPLLEQGAAAPTMATMPTQGGFVTGPPPPDVMPATANGFMPAAVPAEESFGSGLWDRVKGFFGPDKDADPAQQAYDADLSSAGWAGASQAAAEAASNPNLSPIQVLTQALAGYSGAKQRARGELRSEAQQERLFGLKERGLEAELRGQEGTAKRAELKDLREREQVQRAQEAVTSLPEGPQRDMAQFLVDTGQTDDLFKLLNPEKKAPIKFGNQLRDPDTLEVLATEAPEGITPYQAADLALRQQAAATREPRDAPVTYRTLSPAEVTEMGLPAGTVVKLSNRGEPTVLYKPGGESGSIPSFAQLQALRDAAPPGKARDELQAQIDKLNVSGSGSAGAGVRLPQGYYMTEPSEGAKKAGVTGPVAAPTVGIPDYGKAVGAIQSSSKFLTKLNKIEKIFSEYGTQILPSEVKGQLTSLANDAKLDYAQAKGQGALQSTDDRVIGSVLGAILDPNMMFPGGYDQVLAQIGQAKSSVNLDLDGLQLQYPWYDVKRDTAQTPVATPAQPAGAVPADVPKVGAPAANFSGMAETDADAAYDKLPVGATYTDVDGKNYTKTAK